jgi:hypothetical protein
MDYPGIKVIINNNTDKFLFRLDRSTNDVQLRAFNNSGINTGDVQVGGNDLKLFSKFGIDFIFTNSNKSTITSDDTNFKILPFSVSPITLKYGSTISLIKT